MTNKTPHEEALEAAYKAFSNVHGDFTYGVQAAIAAYNSRMAGQVSVEAWNDAFLKGFMASGEGYNGEYPFDFTIHDDARGQKWLEMRDRIRSALTATPPASEKDPAE